MRRLILIVAVAAATVIPAGPASAGQQVHADPANDVVKWHIPTQTGSVDPADRQTDITSLSTYYADRRVTLRLKLRRLPSGDFWSGWDIRTADRLVQAQLTRTGDLVSFVLIDWTSSLRSTVRRGPLLIDCPRASYFIRPGRATLRVAVPRRCFGGGPWVRTGAQIERGYDPDTQTKRADDARLDGTVTGTLFARLGRRIGYN